MFPTVGEGGLGVGGAFGKGHVYVHGHPVGETSMSQLSVGFQAGGKAYSQIIFFEDKRALDEFESGNFEFAAGASAVAITAGASASAATDGTSAGSQRRREGCEGQRRTTRKAWRCSPSRRAVSCIAAAIAGQKFSYKPFGAAQ